MYIVIFIIILLTIILGLLFAKITLIIEKIEINKENIKLQIKVKFLWFCFLPIFMLSLNEEGIKILWKKIKYKKIFETNNLTKIIEKNIKYKKYKKIKNLKIQIDLAKFILKIGTEDIFITTIIITIISNLLAIFFKNNMKNINNQKMDYTILPEFNKNEIYFEGKTNISLKILSLRNFKLNRYSIIIYIFYYFILCMLSFGYGNIAKKLFLIY